MQGSVGYNLGFAAAVCLLMNLFAPLIDYVAIQANVRRRRAHHAG